MYTPKKVIHLQDGTWWEGRRTRNVHQGSCRKLSEEAALKKARELKAAWLEQEATS
jgi:hypothetical protein